MACQQPAGLGLTPKGTVGPMLDNSIEQTKLGLVIWGEGMEARMNELHASGDQVQQSSGATSMPPPVENSDPVQVLASANVNLFFEIFFPIDNC